MKNIGQRIKQRRKQLNITQEALAKKINGITHVAVSNWENGRTVPNAINTVELSAVLNCSLDWLLYGGVFAENKTDILLNENTNIPILDDNAIINSTVHQSQNYILNHRTNISNKAFAYVIKDKAMMPEFYEDDIVIIDPTIPAKTDCFVLVRILDSILFRKLITNTQDGTNVDFSLLPLNSDYLILSSEHQKIEILGTMVEHRIFHMKR